MARHRKKVNTRTGVLTFVTVVVTGVWGASFVLEVMVPDFDTPEGLGDLMMLVIGALFAGRQISASSGSGEDDEERGRGSR